MPTASRGARGACTRSSVPSSRVLVDEIREDALGNLIAVKKGDGFRIMVASHMDEIGLMVNYIDEKGFIRFVTFGGWYAPTLYNQRVILHGSKGQVVGVVGGKPPHVMDEEERKKGVKAENMFIDVGVSSVKEVNRLGIEIGTPVTIDRELADLANRRVTGKAFDNRVGCAVLVKVLKSLKSPHTIYGVFTVQEEVGTKGAKTSSFSLDPDCAIALDSTFPGDHPDIDKKDSCLEMGKGPGHHRLGCQREGAHRRPEGGEMAAKGRGRKEDPVPA